MFRAEYYDIDNNLLFSQNNVQIISYDQKINEKGNAVFVFDTFDCNIVNGKYKKSGIFNTDALKNWQRRVRLYYIPDNNFIFEGWIVNHNIDDELTEVTIFAFHEYAKRKLILSEQAFNQSLLQTVNTLWSQIKSRRNNNITISGDANKVVEVETTYGTLFAQILDIVIDEGYEYRFRNDNIEISHSVGSIIERGMTYNPSSPTTSTVELDNSVQIKGGRQANLCVANDGDINNRYPNTNSYNGDDEIGTYQNFQTDQAEKCKIYVERFASGYRDYNVVLKSEFFAPGQVQAGDFAKVNIQTGFEPFDTVEVIKVVRVRGRSSATGFSIQAQLSNDPLDIRAQEELARRIKTLEDNQ